MSKTVLVILDCSKNPVTFTPEAGVPDVTILKKKILETAKKNSYLKSRIQHEDAFVLQRHCEDFDTLVDIQLEDEIPNKAKVHISETGPLMHEEGRQAPPSRIFNGRNQERGYFEPMPPGNDNMDSDDVEVVGVVRKSPPRPVPPPFGHHPVRPPRFGSPSLLPIPGAPGSSFPPIPRAPSLSGPRAPVPGGINFQGRRPPLLPTPLMSLRFPTMPLPPRMSSFSDRPAPLLPEEGLMMGPDRGQQPPGPMINLNKLMSDIDDEIIEVGNRPGPMSQGRGFGLPDLRGRDYDVEGPFPEQRNMYERRTSPSPPPPPLLFEGRSPSPRQRRAYRRDSPFGDRRRNSPGFGMRRSRSRSPYRSFSRRSRDRSPLNDLYDALFQVSGRRGRSPTSTRNRRRSPSDLYARRRSPSPFRRRSPSPFRRRSPSPGLFRFSESNRRPGGSFQRGRGRGRPEHFSDVRDETLLAQAWHDNMKDEEAEVRTTPPRFYRIPTPPRHRSPTPPDGKRKKYQWDEVLEWEEDELGFNILERESPDIRKIFDSAKRIRTKQPVQMLNEFCQQNGWPVAKFQVTMDGTGRRRPKFQYKVQVGDEWYLSQRYSLNKKQAKVYAAITALYLLEVIG